MKLAIQIHALLARIVGICKATTQQEYRQNLASGLQLKLDHITRKVTRNQQATQFTSREFNLRQIFNALSWTDVYPQPNLGTRYFLTNSIFDTVFF